MKKSNHILQLPQALIIAAVLIAGCKIADFGSPEYLASADETVARSIENIRTVVIDGMIMSPYADRIFDECADSPVVAKLDGLKIEDEKGNAIPFRQLPQQAKKELVRIYLESEREKLTGTVRTAPELKDYLDRQNAAVEEVLAKRDGYPGMKEMLEDIGARVSELSLTYVPATRSKSSGRINESSNTRKLDMDNEDLQKTIRSVAESLKPGDILLTLPESGNAKRRINTDPATNNGIWCGHGEVVTDEYIPETHMAEYELQTWPCIKYYFMGEENKPFLCGGDAIMFREIGNESTGAKISSVSFPLNDTQIESQFKYALTNNTSIDKTLAQKRRTEILELSEEFRTKMLLSMDYDIQSTTYADIAKDRIIRIRVVPGFIMTLYLTETMYVFDTGRDRRYDCRKVTLEGFDPSPDTYYDYDEILDKIRKASWKTVPASFELSEYGKEYFREFEMYGDLTWKESRKYLGMENLTGCWDGKGMGVRKTTLETWFEYPDTWFVLKIKDRKYVYDTGRKKIKTIYEDKDVSQDEFVRTIDRQLGKQYVTKLEFAFAKWAAPNRYTCTSLIWYAAKETWGIDISPWWSTMVSPSDVYLSEYTWLKQTITPKDEWFLKE